MSARRQALAGIGTALGVLLCGAPLGLLWASVAPRAALVATPGGPSLANVETKAFIAADGLLFVLGLAAGVIVTVIAWRLARATGRSTVLLVALVLGGALAAVVAARTGVLFDHREPARAALSRAGTLPASSELPLRLHAKAVLLGWPAGAASTFLALTLWREPQRARVPDQEENGWHR